jgi:hypothetical protein
MNRKKPRREIEMTVATRRQTAQEQRRFESALELLLTEMVRQEITSRKVGTNGGKEFTG